MKTILSYCNIFVMLCSSLTVNAQLSQESDNIRLNDTGYNGSLPALIAQGLQNNYQIRIIANKEHIANNNATRANAGYLPSVNISTGYKGSVGNTNSALKGKSEIDKQRNVVDHSINAGIFAEWTVFDGMKIQTNYKRLQELRKQSATQTRIAIEDYVANLTAEYYNMIQQVIRMQNLRHAVALSKERLRIVQERYIIGSASRLDFQQAKVDFNADSARSLKQYELLASSRIRLNQMMAIDDVTQKLGIQDSAINVDADLNSRSLWESTLKTNAHLLKSAQNKTLAELDFNSVRSRDFPYVKVNAAYNYRFSKMGNSAIDKRNNWGPEFGVSMGYKLFDGNRKRERNNARINIDNAELAERELRLSLKADLEDLWQAYQNNMNLLNLERQNLSTAKENHVIAHERYLLGDLSGIEMREAQQSLLDAEERILVAAYNTKLCEISLHQLSGNIMVYAQ